MRGKYNIKHMFILNIVSTVKSKKSLATRVNSWISGKHDKTERSAGAALFETKNYLVFRKITGIRRSKSRYRAHQVSAVRRTCVRGAVHRPDLRAARGL